MPIRTTTCSRDCPDCCAIAVEVDEAGRAVKLRGVAEDPVTKGFLCERTARFLTRQYAPDRFTSPMFRPAKEEPLRPVSWDFALDWCADKLQNTRRQWGPAAILHYRSGGSMGLLKQLSDTLFEAFGPVTVKRGDICSGAGEAAQEADFGVCDSHDVFDLENSRNIVVWGKNVHTSSVHLLPILLEAKKRGTRLIGIDPVRTRLTSLVDHFIQPKPGTDFALAMAVLHEFLQGPLNPYPAEFCDGWPEFQGMVQARSGAEWRAICGVSAEEVGLLTDCFRQRPTAIQVGWGMARRRNGGACIRALDALAAVTGNLGIPGGGVSYYFRRRAPFDGVPSYGTPPRTLPEALLGPEILAAQDPPIRFAWVTAGNPVSMLPDSDTVRTALLSLDALVVVETHPTDTTDIADLVLPTLTLLEDDDLLGAYGSHFLRSSQPTVEPPGEARHELWIWQQLAQRLGLGDLLAGTPREWKQRMMLRLNAAGVTLEDLERGPVRNPFAPQVLFEGLQFPTPSGKMQLLTEEPAFPVFDPAFPLQLSAFSTPKAQASQWSVAPPGVTPARVHPSLGIQAGEQLWLQTRRGEMRVVIELDEAVHPSMVLLAKGGMLRHAGSPNQLVFAAETDIGGGAAYYDEPVRLVSRPLPKKELEPQSISSFSS
jgi:anaerobic selenocysteine-containing dehydrogenase